MKKCKVCGDICRELGNGKYVCDCCGNTFSEEDFAPRQKQAVKVDEGAKTGDIGADIYEKNVNGVCEISTSSSKGSGYLIDAMGGYVITNSHVVALDDGKSCSTCNVKVADRTVRATVVRMGTEKKNEHCGNRDLALLKLAQVPLGATEIKFGNFDAVRTGERIYVIGNSMGYGTCITSGIISDSNRNGQLMYDCPTNPGNSGGPVFDSKGLVIGTHVAGFSPNGAKVQGMNFAIPAQSVIAFLSTCGYRVNYKKG